LKEFIMKSHKPALKAERPRRDLERWGGAIVFTGLGLVTLVLWVWLSASPWPGFIDPSLGYLAVAALVGEAFVVAWFDDWRRLRAARRAV
jgi:UDP-N-acetylmuramyl pentapeptide phosphotransferase/UDP-N-acetylglucosamine-1-phosphate transferase